MNGQCLSMAKIVSLPNHKIRPHYWMLKVKRECKSVVGSFLYYARAIDNTILPALNEISFMQATPTENTNKKIQMLLDYLYNFKNAKIRFYRSDMQLHVDSDVAYLVAPKAKNRIAGYFYCSDKVTNTNKPDPTLNGPLHVECKVLRHVVTSAAEAETAGLFFNCQTAIYLRRMLTALGHNQQSTQVKTDNGTAAQFVHDTIKIKGVNPGMFGTIG